LSQTPIQQYFTPLRPVITIRDKNNDPTYLFHDSFHPPEPASGSPSIFYCDIDLAYGQAGTFTIRINDPEGQLDPTRIGLGNKVWIQAGRTEDSLFNLFSGVCRRMQPIRSNYNQLGYVMTGMGTQIIMNERIVNFLRTALRRVDNPLAPFHDDPNMKANKLFKVLMVNNDVIPLQFPALKHNLHPGMFNTDEQIDAQVDTFIASLTEPYVEASQVANSIADMAGAIWGVTPGSPTKADRVFLRFPSTLHSGTVIKDRPETPEEYTNKNVSYLRSSPGFSYTDSMLKEDGFTNRIFSKTGADQVSGTTSTNAENFTRMSGIDIAQKITVNSTRFRDLSFTIGAEGRFEAPCEGCSPFLGGDINFRVVNDAGGRPGPISELVSSFPFDVQNGEVKSIFLRIPDNFRFNTLKPGDDAWVILFAEGYMTYSNPDENDCGTANPDHCAHWHHDGGNSGVSAIRTVCDPRGLGNRSPTHEDTSTGWVINNAGPTYSHSFFDTFSHIVEASDQESINRYGEIDAFIDASWITEEATMNQYLASILQYSAKPRRIYEMAEIFIPYNDVIQPGSLVTVIDTKAGFTANKNIMAEVQEVRYEFSAQSPGTTPLGTNVCEVRLLGYVDFREDFIQAVGQQSLNLPIPIVNPPPPPPPPVDPTLPPGTFLDTDGVKIIMPINTAQGKFHRNMVGLPNLGASTWTSSTYFKHDCQGNSATKNTLGGLTYWTMDARQGSFASTGQTNYTCRPTWVSNSASTPAGLSGAKSRGYLADANDPKNIEFTAIVRVKQIEDNNEEATFKWCGDTHVDTSEKTLQGASKFPYGSGDGAELFAFEKTHPSDRRADVTFVSPYTSSNYPKVSQNVWRGIKTIKYNINNNQGIHVEWWIDEDPIVGGGSPTGAFTNNWKKFAVYEEQKSDTPVWGGPHNTLRTDMAHQVDLAAFNIHEIIPPATTGQTATATTLAERGEFEESTGLQAQDYVSELVPTSETTTKESSSFKSIVSDEAADVITEAINEDTGQTLTPKTISREMEPVSEQVDEIDQTFGEIDMSGADP
jgi:hypothetical protein